MSSSPTLYAIVLAAGEGSRMRSERPKPLHRLCGRPMLRYVLSSLDEVDVGRAAIVVGHKAERVTKKIGEEELRFPVEFVEQRVQRGTGDAALVGLVGLPSDDAADDGDVLIMPGDTPLLRASTIAALVDQHRSARAAATVLTARLDNPSGYGRIVRNRDGNVTGVVEDRDATDEQRQIDEINTSIYCFRRGLLAPALRRLSPENSQGEYYLTDVVGVLAEAGHPVRSMVVDDPGEAAGVNDRRQLALAEHELRHRTNRQLMAAGVTMMDPATTYVDTTVEIGRDVTLFPGTLLQGATTIGDGCELGPNAHLVDCAVGANTVVESSTARSSSIGADCHVGPFVSVGPAALIPDGTRTGSHCEISADLGDDSAND